MAATENIGRWLRPASGVGMVVGMGLGAALPALSLPPPEDTPEEILRTEIIIEARSPLTGEPLTVAEYAALQAELRDDNDAVAVSSDVRQLIFLLQLRRGVRPLIPFIP